MKILRIYSIEILDSRGNPTLKTSVELENGILASASVPSGMSVGTYEALELRDADPKRYLGLGVLKAVDNVNSNIAKILKGQEIEDINRIDRAILELDGTDKKSALGANAILSVSLAVARALSLSIKKPLWKTLNEYYFNDTKPSFPRIMVNIVNGGRHAHWNFDIQEFMISPRTNTPSSSVQISSEIFHHLRGVLEENNFSPLQGDEGGYAPRLSSIDELFRLMLKAINKAGYRNAYDVDFAIDAAANEFMKNGQYVLKNEEKSLLADELIYYFLDMKKKYEIMSFEDPCSENDWSAFKKFTLMIGDKCMVVGDDLYTTNTVRIKRGIDEKATNAVLIKPNQIGSLCETVEAIKLARSAGMKIVISNRSGETEDSFISDLAVASAAEFLKAGSMSRSERLAKYNRLLEIEKFEWDKSDSTL